MNKKIIVFIFIFLIISLIYSYLNLTKIYESKYTGKEEYIIGYIRKINYKDNKIKLEIRGKEKIIGTYKTDKKLDLKLNDKVLLKGTLEEPTGNTIPNTFNYKKYLYNNKIYYVIEINEIIKLKDNNNLFYKIKNNIIKKINKYKSSKYLHTFILGDNKYIDDDINDSYRSNGINHLFSVSGMHVSFLSALIIYILKKINKKDTVNYIIVSIFLMFYIFLVNYTPSANRSVILYILIAIKKILKIDIKTIYLLILDFSILIFINPFYLYNLGFIYSFTITFYLILFSYKLKSKNYFVSIFKVSLMAFIVSLPINLYINYEINILSILYNLFFVPVVSLILFPLAFLVIFIPLLDNLYYCLFDLLNNISIFLSNNNLTLIFIKPNLFVVLVYYLLITLMLYNKKYIWMFLVLISIHYNLNYLIKKTFISIIDVGQGDGILLYSNNKSMLIDTGNKNEYLANNMIKYFKSLGIKQIDYLVITHGDIDHIGNAKYLINNFNIKKLYINNNKVNSNEKELYNLMKVEKIKEKDIFYLNNIKLININKEFENENDSSIIFYMTINKYSILLTGDATIKSEDYILDNYNIDKIDILKVGHHGSNTSTSKRFINKIRPKKCLISVGKNNRYGHPKPIVLKTLEKCNIYRTDLNGTIVINFI